MDSGTIVSGKETGLHLSGPIPELRQTQNRVTRQMALELKLIKPVVIEAAKFQGQPTEHSDDLDLCGDDVNNEAEARSPGKLEAVLGFRLYLGKLISHCQKVRDQLVPAISRERKITNSVGGVEGAADQIA